MFMDLLVLADMDGVVDMTLEAIARRTNVPIEQVTRCIGYLSQPDPKSRSAYEHGARIKLIDSHRDWGWQIINYAHYRELRDEESRRAYFRDYKRKQRAKKRGGQICPTLSNFVQLGTSKSTHAEAEAEAEAEVFKTILSGKPDRGYHKQARTVLHLLNDASGKHYRETDANLAIISQRLAEPEVNIAGIRQMLTRQARLWKGGAMDKYLRPETLFAKSKFDSYYAQRHDPTHPQSNPSGAGNRNEGIAGIDTYQQALAAKLARSLAPKMAGDGNLEPGS